LTIAVHIAHCITQVLAVVLGNPKPDSQKKANSSSAGGSSKSNSSSLNGKRKRAEAASSSSGGGSSSSSSKSGSTTGAGDDNDEADNDSAAGGSDIDDDVDVELKEQLQTTFSYDVEGGVPTKATLVVTPASLMGQVSSALLLQLHALGHIDVHSRNTVVAVTALGVSTVSLEGTTMVPLRWQCAMVHG
jgi:hypothetical protein